MPFIEILRNFWLWIANTGLDMAMWIVLALLVPRIGRLIMRFIERGLKNEDENETKTHLAIAGVVIYIAQLIAYFLILIFLLQDMGMSLAGAAIPATAASAALALGAQSIVSDFLAGFFILTERHYGVGDWVRFEGGSTTQEGTVIQITMRATRIRTLSEETVIIPNSKAGVSINNSNYWSSAVLVMPVPLLGSHSISETMQRAEAAARKALQTPAIASQTLGELNMQEPIDVTAPNTVGMPWTVSLRFLCQVKPGSQWQVERAMRTAIIEEFWEEYGSAPTLTGAVANTLTPAEFNGKPGVLSAQHENASDASKSHAPADTELMHADEIEAALNDAAEPELADATARTQENGAQDGSPDSTPDAAKIHTAPTEVLHTDAVREDDDLPTTVLAAADAAPTVRLPIDDAVKADEVDELTAETEHLAAQALVANKLTNLPSAQDPEHRDLAAVDPAADASKMDKKDKHSREVRIKGFKSRIHRIFTVGDRTRASTTILLLILFLVLLLKGFTYTNADTDTSGWLAPRTTTAESTTESTEVENTPETTTSTTAPTTTTTPQTDSRTQQQTTTATTVPTQANTQNTDSADATTDGQSNTTEEQTQQDQTASDPLLQLFGSSSQSSEAGANSNTGS